MTAAWRLALAWAALQLLLVTGSDPTAAGSGDTVGNLRGSPSVQESQESGQVSAEQLSWDSVFQNQSLLTAFAAFLADVEFYLKATDRAYRTGKQLTDLALADMHRAQQEADEQMQAAERRTATAVEDARKSAEEHHEGVEQRVQEAREKAKKEMAEARKEADDKIQQAREQMEKQLEEAREQVREERKQAYASRPKIDVDQSAVEFWNGLEHESAESFISWVADLSQNETTAWEHEVSKIAGVEDDYCSWANLSLAIAEETLVMEGYPIPPGAPRPVIPHFHAIYPDGGLAQLEFDVELEQKEEAAAKAKVANGEAPASVQANGFWTKGLKKMLPRILPRHFPHFHLDFSHDSRRRQPGDRMATSSGEH